MMIRRLMLFVAALWVVGPAGPALAWTNFLNSEVGGGQTQRYCRYSDGSTYAAPAGSSCPNSVDAPTPGIGGNLTPPAPVFLPQIVVPPPIVLPRP
jgi:hypothetical protein